MEFDIRYDEPTPRIEQETSITYDKELNTWHLYTTVPSHARKWEDAIVASDVFLTFKTYHNVSKELIAIAGEINGSASVRKRVSLTDEQRQAASERLSSIRLNK